MTLRKVLTEKIVEKYFAGQDSVDLCEFTAIEDAAAVTLARHQASLRLNGLESLSEKAAIALGKHEGTLELNGLSELSETAARGLASHRGELSLRGLTYLSERAAESLQQLVHPIVEGTRVPFSYVKLSPIEKGMRCTDAFLRLGLQLNAIQSLIDDIDQIAYLCGCNHEDATGGKLGDALVKFAYRSEVARSGRFTKELANAFRDCLESRECFEVLEEILEWNIEVDDEARAILVALRPESHCESSGEESNDEDDDIDDDENEWEDDGPRPERADPSSTITNSIGMKLVEIPGGTFMMGSPENEEGRLESELQHKVTLTNDFYLGMTQVTQAQYEKVMGQNPSHFQGDEVKGRDSSEFPVERVSWEDALEFCKKLSEMPEEKAAGRVYRLPTEAEWEYACRTDSTTAYCFGNDEGLLSDYAWFNENSEDRPHPVALKEPNAWSLYDMHGNVWEWCSDWYGDYPENAVTDPLGPAEGSYRVIRGGGCCNEAAVCRSAFRDGSNPSDRDDNDYGFRVALNSSGIPK